jgi:hypothetical protein
MQHRANWRSHPYRGFVAVWSQISCRLSRVWQLILLLTVGIVLIYRI